MNADGSKQKNLTRNKARDGAPVWSPTGKHIAFHSDRDGTRDIYIMDPDGRNVRKVLRNLSYREYPTWSPDGKRLAYTRSEDWSICIADIEERIEESVAFTNIVSGFADWSPDGSEIVFIFVKPSDYRIHIINLKTRKQIELPLPPNSPPPHVKPRFFYFPARSPDGDKIAFSWRTEGLHFMNHDGRGVGTSPQENRIIDIRRLVEPKKPNFLCVVNNHTKDPHPLAGLKILHQLWIKGNWANNASPPTGMRLTKYQWGE